MHAFFALFILLQAPNAAPPGAAPSPSQATAAAPVADRPESMGCGMQGLMIAGMFAVMYFLMIRPEGQRRREAETLQSSLVKGVKVRTSGGILGEIVSIDERDAVLQIAPGVKMTVLRGAIASLETPGKDAVASSTPTS